MTASLNGLDVLVFFAGAGENQSLLRELTCEGLSYLGLKIDKAKNDRVTNDKDLEITQSASAVKVLVIHTQEEWAIASACKYLIKTAVSV